MPYARIVALTSLAMIAFAGNSQLCRVALIHTSIDAASFTVIRLISGAIMLWLVVQIRSGTRIGRGNWSPGLHGASIPCEDKVQPQASAVMIFEVHSKL